MSVCIQKIVTASQLEVLGAGLAADLYSLWTRLPDFATMPPPSTGQMTRSL
jgi:hypothetical protein